ANGERGDQCSFMEDPVGSGPQMALEEPSGYHSEPTMSSAAGTRRDVMKGVGPGAIALALSVLATAPLAHAQSHPSRPIMLVNPSAAGGPADGLARPLASAMADSLGQQVVILNKPGAATAIAAQHVARAPADGYTLLLSTASAHIVTPALTPKINYDGIRDF